MNKRIVSLSCAVLVVGAVFAAFADDSTTNSVKPYILKTCIVSGEKLGEMGDSVTITNSGREVKFCCKECVAKFNKTPDKYVKKIEKLEKKEAAK